MSLTARLKRLEREISPRFDPCVGLANRLRVALNSDEPYKPPPPDVLERWEKSSDPKEQMHARLCRALSTD